MRHWSRAKIIECIIYIIVIIAVCVWETRKTSRQKNMKLRMTKRINVVIESRVGGSRGYRYFFTGLEEYGGVLFNGMLLRVKKRFEKGEIVPLLVNEHKLEEFWFEDADEPGKWLIAAWVAGVLGIFICTLCIVITIMDWETIPWF